MAIINPTLNPKAEPIGPSVPGGMDSLPINNICGTPVCDEEKESIVITPTSTKIGNEYAGTSDKSKPVSVPQYSIYFELDTGKFYYYDNGSWSLIPCGSGGGDDPQADGPAIVLNSVPVENVFLGTASDSLSSLQDNVTTGNLSLCGDGVYCFNRDLIGMEVYFSFTHGTSVRYFVDGTLSSDCNSINGSICGPFELTEDTTFYFEPILI